MKTILLSLLCIFSCFKLFSKNIDTIEVRKVKGSYLFLIKGQQIKPLSDNSVLKNFHESNNEYLSARQHVRRGTNYFCLGAAMDNIGLSLNKNTALHYTLSAAGSLLACEVFIQFPKTKRHL